MVPAGAQHPLSQRMNWKMEDELVSQVLSDFYDTVGKVMHGKSFCC